MIDFAYEKVFPKSFSATLDLIEENLFEDIPY
jgi:hypothetical protein